MSHKSSKVQFKAGETIMRQGENSNSAYIIEKGRVEISVRQHGGLRRVLGTRGPGTMIGEMAIVDNAPRTATITALEDCEFIEITREDFLSRLENADPVLQMTTQVILARYRDMLARAEISRESRTWPPIEAVELNLAERTDAVETLKLGNDFKTGLAAGQVSLHYQPIMDLGTGRVCGFEALMRWMHPERGAVSPSLFIPVLEDSGFILEASRWALREACSALRRLEDRMPYGSDLFMSVNFSSRDFASDNFVESAYETISATDIPLSRVHLEITERMLMEQPQSARETLLSCRKAGMGIAIDDFGTGYSSLSYLHYFPIDTLKIDQSFVQDMLANPKSLELVKSMVALARNMDLKVIAEGVENHEEAELLRGMGCAMAQGFYFARPMPEADIAAFLKTAAG